MKFSVAVRFILNVDAQNKDDATESVRYELMKHFGEDQAYDLGAIPMLERRSRS